MKQNRNSGSALVVAIVVMLAVLVISMLLLLVSYNLFSGTLARRNGDPCLELAQSFSTEIRRTLAGPAPNSAEELQRELTEPAVPLWAYLRWNLLQTHWPAGESRSFDLSATEDAAQRLAQLNARLTVSIDCQRTEGQTYGLTVTVCCSANGQTARAAERYTLTIGQYAPAAGTRPYTASTGLNPNHHTIDLNENWVITPVFFSEQTQEVAP